MAEPWQPPPLAPYAAEERRSRGRAQAEPPPRYRGEFQRDRDRIVHSAAFRRLEYKTQVFVNHEGDLFRTRLTHSMEVAQIARSAARALGLNEDLTEAIALAHDLGHTPFGHAGQEALNACMRDHGGFEHNLQSLRVVDELETRYAAFRGLNLTYETREGILKHCSRRNAEQLGELGARFLRGQQPGLEAQLTNLADGIAYNSHDVDDGLRAGLLEIMELQDVALFAEPYAQVRHLHPGLDDRGCVHEVIRRMIDRQVVDLIETTQARLTEIAPADIDAVRNLPQPLVGFSPAMQEQERALRAFLHERLYRHYRVHRMTRKAQRVVTALFEAFFADPRLLPRQAGPVAREPSGIDGAQDTDRLRARAVADYIAGMTDRYAIAEHGRIFDPSRRT